VAHEAHHHTPGVIKSNANMVSLTGEDSHSRASAIKKTDSAPRQLLLQPLVPARVNGYNMQAWARICSISRVKARHFLLAFHGYLEQKEGCSAVGGWKTGTWLSLTREEQRHEY
jgi:hypothetical protein